MITDREKKVIERTLEGKTTKEIAKDMFMSVRTVENVKSKLIFNLGCSNLYEVIGICFRKGWVK